MQYKITNMTRINPNYIFTCLIRFHTETPIIMPLCNIILVCDFHRKKLHERWRQALQMHIGFSLPYHSIFW